MRYFSFLVLFGCLLLSPLAAEVIGNVEYRLPNQGKGWKVATQVEGNKKIKSTTIVYIPEYAEKETAREFFGAHVNDLATMPNDQASLESGIAKQFPNSQVKVTILDQNEANLLYEWNVSDNGQNKVHGWTRIFYSPQGNVMLAYQTDQMENVSANRSLWIQILKNAKVVK